MQLKNERLKGRSTVTAYGTLKFDLDGFLTEPELNEGQIKAFKGLRGFEIVAESDETPTEVKPPIDEDSAVQQAADEFGEVLEGGEATKTPDTDDTDSDNAEEADTEEEASVDYDADFTADELRKKAEERNLEVKGTGNRGSVIKRDLVKALEADDASKK